MTYKIYNNFIEFMKELVNPLKNENPNDIRLDGQLSGGNRTVFGRFKHFGCTWEVNSDTRYEPLRLAYEAAIKGNEPFVEGTTKGGNPMLILQSEIKQLQSTKRKYLYIY